MSKQSDLISVSQGAAGDPLFIDTANNRVGVGTSSPSFKLSVKQSAQTFNGGIALERSDNTNRFNIAIDSNTTLNIGYNDSTKAVITSTGAVGIGTSSPNARLHVAGGFQQITNGSSSMFMGDGVSLVSGSSAAASAVRFDGDALLFSYSATERMRIDASGNLLVGTTTARGKITVQYSTNSSANPTVYFGNDGGTGVFASFGDASGTVIGTITRSGSSTSYNTSSDYRLKENVTSLTGAADRLAQIPVCRFNFIADPDTTVDGFLAHEVQAFVPECVTGEKDQVETVEVTDEDGNVIGTEERPVYQGIDQSKLVPLLTAALQEALQKIDALETRISALETN